MRSFGNRRFVIQFLTLELIIGQYVPGNPRENKNRKGVSATIAVAAMTKGRIGILLLTEREGWAQVIRCARTNPAPFEVTKMSYDQIIDFAALSQPLKKAIPWRKVCMVQYSKSDAGAVEIQYKEDYAEEFKPVTNYIKQPKGRRRTSDGSLPKAYRQTLKISSAKYKDLMKMCKDRIILPEYHPYYEGLQPSSNVPDRLPEPDEEEDSVYEDEEDNTEIAVV